MRHIQFIIRYAFDSVCRLLSTTYNAQERLNGENCRHVLFGPMKKAKTECWPAKSLTSHVHTLVQYGSAVLLLLLLFIRTHSMCYGKHLLRRQCSSIGVSPLFWNLFFSFLFCVRRHIHCVFAGLYCCSSCVLRLKSSYCLQSVSFWCAWTRRGICTRISDRNWSNRGALNTMENNVSSSRVFFASFIVVSAQFRSQNRNQNKKSFLQFPRSHNMHQLNGQRLMPSFDASPSKWTRNKCATNSSRHFRALLRRNRLTSYPPPVAPESTDQRK